MSVRTGTEAEARGLIGWEYDRELEGVGSLWICTDEDEGVGV